MPISKASSPPSGVQNVRLTYVCVLALGVFYVIINGQAVYINELLGLKKVCFAPGICKVGFSVNSLNKYMNKLKNLRISFVVLKACNMNSDADYTYKLKRFKNKYEYIDERFVSNKNNYICDCNKCSFKKTEVVKELRRLVSSLSYKISNLALIKDDEVKSKFKVDETVYEELMIWNKLDE